MTQYKTKNIALLSGVIAVMIGLLTFTVSWLLWDLSTGPMPGYELLLFPGNLTLVYIWHPLFTEEINLIPKLILMLMGQFTVVFCSVGVLIWVVRKIFNKTL